jgi:hypothetical protein
MILVKFYDNYADEFDTEGFSIMTQEELDLFLAYARERFIRATSTEKTEYRWYGRPEDNPHIMKYQDKDVECYFGTNEQWMWADYEDFMYSLSFRRITVKDAWVLENFLGTDYGMFPMGMGDY